MKIIEEYSNSGHRTIRHAQQPTYFNLVEPVMHKKVTAQVISPYRAVQNKSPAKTQANSRNPSAKRRSILSEKVY